jgi:hypothetical protein
MEAIGRYSYLLLGLVLLVGGLVAGAGRVPNDILVLGAAGLLGVLAIFWVFGKRGDSYAHPDKVLKKVVGRGRPVVIHFYSNYSLGCLIRKIRFEARQRRFAGRVQFINLNLNLGGAQAIAAELEARLGEYILFDAAGQERGRTRLPAEADLLGLLQRSAKG